MNRLERNRLLNCARTAVQDGRFGCGAAKVGIWSARGGLVIDVSLRGGRFFPWEKLAEMFPRVGGLTGWQGRRAQYLREKEATT